MTEHHLQSWTPAFPGQRPPFQPGNEFGVRFAKGNELQLVHGASTERAIQERLPPVVLEVYNFMFARVPHLEPCDSEAVERCARKIVRVRMVEEHLDRTSGGSPIDSRGRSRSCMELLDRLECSLDRSLNDLGLTPAGRARLRADTSSAVNNSFAAQLAKERAEMERERRG